MIASPGNIMDIWDKKTGIACMVIRGVAEKL
jgi:hypothetical protein